MKDQTQKKNMAGLIIKLVILTLLLAAVVVTWAWFTKSVDDSGKYTGSLAGVDYRFVGTQEDIFVRQFEISDPDYDDDGKEIDEYVPAVTAGIILPDIAGEIVEPVDIQLGDTLKCRPLFSPTNATDKKTWSSSDETVAKVSKYGRITALKEGEATITLVASDRTPGSTRGDLTATLRIRVVPRTTPIDPDAEIFVPAGAEILNKSIQLYNASTVNTKLRAVVNWEYARFRGDDGSSDPIKRTTYPVAELFASHTAMQLSPVQAPLLLTFSKTGSNTQWHNAPAAGKLSFTDTAGFSWNILQLSLTDAEHTRLADAASTASDISLTMVDSAEGIFYFGQTAYSADTPDYGDVIAPVADAYGNVTDEALAQSALTVLEHIVVSDNYTAYSTLKMFRVRVTIQARQADHFVPGTGDGREDSWYDVYSCDFNYPTTTTSGTDVAATTTHTAHF